MGTKIQVTIDCADPGRLARFWAEALRYKLEDPPAGHATWREYWLSIGVPPDELGDDDGADSVVDPDGVGPRIWFQQVPESKVAKNRVHLDLGVSGGRTVALQTRTERVNAEVDRLMSAGATRLRVTSTEGVDHYGVVMQDPEGNEFCVH